MLDTPQTNSTLSDLLARVEAATGPDRSIDGAIAATLQVLPDLDQERGKYLFPNEIELEPEENGSAVSVYAKGEDGVMRYVLKRYADPFTFSIDAALVLVEKKLPKWHWTVDNGKPCRACIVEHFDIDASGAQGYAATPALAILAAFLRVLKEIEHEEIDHIDGDPRNNSLSNLRRVRRP